MPAAPAAAPQTAPAPPGGVSFEAAVEGGVIRVPPEWRGRLGPSVRVLVSVPAAAEEPAAPAIDLGDLEGTPMADLMRNPLSTPDGRYLDREERNARR